MKISTRLIVLTLIMSLTLHAWAQKDEKVIIYKKNGDILKGKIEYLTENNKVRLNTSCGISYLLDRTEINKIEKQEIIVDKKNKIYGNAEIGLLIGFNRNTDFYGIPFNFSLSSGYRINNHLAIGVSSGIRMFYDTYIPITADVIYDFNPRKSGKSHFFRLKTGIPYILNNDDDYLYSLYSSYYPYPSDIANPITKRKGFIFNPELGVKFKGQSNESFYLSLAYLYQYDKYEHKNYYNQPLTEEHYYNRIMLNFGYFF